MTGLYDLIRRNCKLFFKDKGIFFTSLITPIVLLVLYITFLGGVYKEAYTDTLDGAEGIPEKLLRGLVGGQLVSSLLAVCCVTVSFCSNMLMVQDKANGTIRDLTVSPIKKSTLAWGYYIATSLTTLIVCVTAFAAGMIYLAAVGWYLSLSDALCVLLDVFLLVMFGTALSSCVNFFLSSQGQISAVGSVVSSFYGFVCGAYMPISEFSPILQRVISFLPGTYGTALLRGHCMNGAFEEMKNCGISEKTVEEFRNGVDCTVSFFGHSANVGAMYAVLIGGILLFAALYVFLNIGKRKKTK